MVGSSAEATKVIPDLIDIIINRAEGVFLWVSFVVQTLKMEIHRGSWTEARRNAVNAAPGDLWGYYEHIVNRLESGGGAGLSEGIRMLQWVVFAKRPMSLSELQYAITVDQPGFYSIGVMEQSEGIIASASELEKRLLVVSGGLLEANHQPTAG